MELLQTHPVIKAFVCGSLSGACSTLLFQPLDLVKTRLQTQQTLQGGRLGMVSMFLKVVRTEKPLGLWKGVSPSLARTVPGVGIYFGAYDWLRQGFFQEEEEPLGPTDALLLGGGARVVAGVLLLPVTVVKARFESGRYDGYGSVSGALRSVYRAEGATALFSGLTATLLRGAPFSGLYLLFYGQTRALLPTGEVRGSAYWPLAQFGCGLAAGVLASLFTQPADVVKTHMQVNPRPYCKRTTDAVRYVYAEHGFRGFFSGAVPRSLRRSMMAAMAWTVYEWTMARVGLLGGSTLKSKADDGENREE